LGSSFHYKVNDDFFKDKKNYVKKIQEENYSYKSILEIRVEEGLWLDALNIITVIAQNACESHLTKIGQLIFAEKKIYQTISCDVLTLSNLRGVNPAVASSKKNRSPRRNRAA